MDKELQSIDELTLMDHLAIIKKHRIMLLVIVSVSVLVTAVVSLLKTPIYEAKALIAPVVNQNISGMSAFSAQMGIIAPQPTNVSEILNILNSNVLREKVIKKHSLLPVFFDEKTLDGKTEEQKLWAGLRYMQGAFTAKYKQKENLIEISMRFRDPAITAKVINYILAELTEHMSTEAKRVAETNRRYLESDTVMSGASDPFIRNKIFNLIAQQIETGMMAEVKENFAFKVLDPPKVPDRRIRPDRRRMVMIAFLASLFAGVFIVYAWEYLDREKKGNKGGLR